MYFIVGYIIHYLFVILDMLFKNQIVMDVTNAIHYLMQTTLYSCSNNPQIATLPMVRLTISLKF